MKEVKYIPLDLVKADKNPNIIWKVKDVSQDKRGNVLYRVVAAEDNDAFIYLYEHQIAPVPLTPEILEKNGWVKDTRQHCLDEIPAEAYEKKDFPLTYFNVTFGKKRIQASHDSLFVRNLKYVSDLQHLLFGLGLNHEMEV